MKKGDVIRQKCVNTTFYLTGILAHKVNNTREICSIKSFKSVTWYKCYHNNPKTICTLDLLEK